MGPRSGRLGAPAPCYGHRRHAAVAAAATRRRRSTPLACSPFRRTRLLENEIRVLRDESNRLTHEKAGLAERIKVRHARRRCPASVEHMPRSDAPAAHAPAHGAPDAAALRFLLSSRAPMPDGAHSCHPACLAPAAAALPCTCPAAQPPPPCPSPAQENQEKIKLNNQLPYLVSNIVEVLDVDPEEEEEEDGACALPPGWLPAWVGLGGSMLAWAAFPHGWGCSFLRACCDLTGLVLQCCCPAARCRCCRAPPAAMPLPQPSPSCHRQHAHATLALPEMLLHLIPYAAAALRRRGRVPGRR